MDFFTQETIYHVCTEMRQSLGPLVINNIHLIALYCMEKKQKQNIMKWNKSFDKIHNFIN